MKCEELMCVSRTQVRQLRNTVANARQVLILTHGNPDPDSIASAFALKYIIGRLADCRVRVAYTGVIGRMENRTMIDELQLLMVKLDEIKWRSYDILALVDHQPRRRMYPWPKNRWPDIIIDHHPRRRFEQPVTMTDVRTGFGSNSALLASYLYAMDIKPPRWLATALVYGILTDTQQFSRGNIHFDKQLYLWLFSYVDHQKLNRISNPIKECRYITDHWKGIKNARLWHDVAESYVGNLVVPDLTAQIADDLMSVRGVKYSMVSGYHENTLYASLRIRHPRRDAGSLIRKLVGRKGSAGGHGRMAGAQISDLESETDAAKIANALHRQLTAVIHPNTFQELNPVNVIKEDEE